ncbi:hypothetical protein [Streptomyces sp. NPDC058572]|uniref:hypothetical protein n=1 Tax=Streptomyces sp. NPDC058572 TaxID=3346546 RepID=UPI0036682220
MRRRTGIAAVALCLGGALTACGGGSGDGRVPVGAAGSGPSPTAAVPPEGDVVLVPLDGSQEGPRWSKGPEDSKVPSEAPRRGTTDTSGGPAPSDRPDGGGTGGGTGGSGGTDGPAPGPPTTPDPPGPPGSTTRPAPPPAPAPSGPAVLRLAEPVRAALDERWCEKVTVEFRNTGGSPAASGTVTFATHIIGALGIDWATVESSQPLPAPIAPGTARKKAYTVCVDAWRVPLGMHIETQDVTADWK